MLSIFKTVNIALAFFLELCLLTALVYWGFHLKQNLFIRILAGVGLPLAVALLWGTFLSPKAIVPLSFPAKMLCKTAIFGGTAVLLYSTGRTNLAVSFALVTAINFLLIIIWKQ